MIARTITRLRLVVGTPLKVALPLWSEVIRRALTKAKRPSKASARPEVSKVPPPGKLTTQTELPLGLEQDTRTGDPNTDSETRPSDAPQVLAQVIGPDTSTELKLMVAYSAAEHSYGKASRDHQAHHGQQDQSCPCPMKWCPCPMKWCPPLPVHQATDRGHRCAGHRCAGHRCAGHRCAGHRCAGHVRSGATGNVV
jgi:hypothetical protein